MNTKKLIHYAIILACPLLTAILPAPEGLTNIRSEEHTSKLQSR